MSAALSPGDLPTDMRPMQNASDQNERRGRGTPPAPSKNPGALNEKGRTQLEEGALSWFNDEWAPASYLHIDIDTYLPVIYNSYVNVIQRGGISELSRIREELLVFRNELSKLETRHTYYNNPWLLDLESGNLKPEDLPNRGRYYDPPLGSKHYEIRKGLLKIIGFGPFPDIEEGEIHKVSCIIDFRLSVIKIVIYRFLVFGDDRNFDRLDYPEMLKSFGYFPPKMREFVGELVGELDSANIEDLKKGDLLDLIETVQENMGERSPFKPRASKGAERRTLDPVDAETIYKRLQGQVSKLGSGYRRHLGYDPKDPKTLILALRAILDAPITS